MLSSRFKHFYQTAGIKPLDDPPVRVTSACNTIMSVLYSNPKFQYDSLMSEWLCDFTTPGTITTEFCWSHCFHNRSQWQNKKKGGGVIKAKYEGKIPGQGQQRRGWLMERRKENLQMNLNVYSFSFFLNLLSQILLSSMILPKLVPFRLILLKNMNNSWNLSNFSLQTVKFKKTKERTERADQQKWRKDGNVKIGPRC